MTKKLNELIHELYDSIPWSPWRSPFDEIFTKDTQGKKLYTLELIERLSDVSNTRDEVFLNLLLMISDADGLDDQYTKIFCQLLNEKWHRQHEEIIVLLEQMKDESSVQTVYQTALDIPDWDDARGLAKKCIYTLAAINTESAKTYLEKLTMHDDLIIADFAKGKLARWV